MIVNEIVGLKLKYDDVGNGQLSTVMTICC